MSRRRNLALTELEGCTLGLIWTNGPCTAYAVRAEFLRSPSVHWSGSAGAIYPLIRRLRARSLIAARPARQGARRATEYSLTAKGAAALKSWTSGTLEPWVVAIPMDPLRVRLRFAGILTAADRRRLIAAAADALRPQVDDAQAFLEQHRDDPAAYWLGRGALHTAKARLEWIEEMLAELER